ncbi:MAG: mechanosensitive ion channel [Bacteroidales bacterium]|nr:mechanosensitive ion channel [Bacteroidales bacterium]
MNVKEILEYQIKVSENVSFTIYSLIVALLIIIATRLLIWGIKRILKRQEKRNHIEVGKSYTIYQVIKYSLWVIAITFILETLGFKITILLAGSAALLVGLGLGLQEIFKDIVSGVFMLFEGNLKVGDILELEGMVGKVKEVGLRTSKMETRDNIIIVVPNSKFITGNVINWSHIDTKTRFNVEVGVAYGSDVNLVEKVLLSCAEDNKNISQTPKPFVRFNNFGESSLDFQLFFWTVDSFGVENIKSQLRFSIDKAFRDNQITIPFPQRDVYLKK